MINSLIFQSLSSVYRAPVIFLLTVSIVVVLAAGDSMYMISNEVTSTSNYAVGHFTLNQHTDWTLCLWYRQPRSCTQDYRETVLSISHDESCQ